MPPTGPSQRPDRCRHAHHHRRAPPECAHQPTSRLRRPRAGVLGRCRARLTMVPAMMAVAIPTVTTTPITHPCPWLHQPPTAAATPMEVSQLAASGPPQHAATPTPATTSGQRPLLRVLSSVTVVPPSVRAATRLSALLGLAVQRPAPWPSLLPPAGATRWWPGASGSRPPTLEKATAVATRPRHPPSPTP